MSDLLDKADTLLMRLGRNPTDVAANLMRAGCLGTPDSNDDDPVCRYLKRMLGTQDVNIEYGSVFVDSNGGWSPSSGLPGAVDEFLTLFDQGKFPHLIDRTKPRRRP